MFAGPKGRTPHFKEDYLAVARPDLSIYTIMFLLQKSLEDAKTKKEGEISDLEAKCEELKSQMGELKAHLYGKFGSHINLENEEE